MNTTKKSKRTTSKKPRDPHRVARFQYYAFDPDLNGTDGIVDLLDTVDGDEVFSTATGFQIRKIRAGYKKTIPDLARTYGDLRQFLLKVFPKLQTDQKQRAQAGRWARIVTLYHLNAWSESEVANEMNLSISAVRSIVRSIKRASNKLNPTPTDGA